MTTYTCPRCHADHLTVDACVAHFRTYHGLEALLAARERAAWWTRLLWGALEYAALATILALAYWLARAVSH